jgi:hypothetical protein
MKTYGRVEVGVHVSWPRQQMAVSGERWASRPGRCKSPRCPVGLDGMEKRQVSCTVENRTHDTVRHYDLCLRRMQAHSVAASCSADVAIHHRNNLSYFMLRNVWLNLFMLPWCMGHLSHQQVLELTVAAQCCGSRSEGPTVTKHRQVELRTKWRDSEEAECYISEKYYEYPLGGDFRRMKLCLFVASLLYVSNVVIYMYGIGRRLLVEGTNLLTLMIPQWAILDVA